MHYSQLDVWQQAVDLSIEVYWVTRKFPSDERFGLTAQLRRAAVSIPSNIAEGEGRRTWRDRAHFYLQARGSLYEVHTQLVIAECLGYCGRVNALFEHSDRVATLINGCLRNLDDLRIANSE